MNRYSLIPFFIILLLPLLYFIFLQREPIYLQPVTSKYIFSSDPNVSSIQVKNTFLLTKTIVVSHFNENLDWLNVFNQTTEISHMVYTRSIHPLSYRHQVLGNKGREAVAYLRYIIDHYSNLSSSIAFVHAHRTSWHQKDPSDIVIALKTLQWNKYNYMPLTSAMTYAEFKQGTNDPQSTVNYEIWRNVLQTELGSPPENGIRAPCCATFAVKKEAILTHPKEFYRNIMNYILSSPHSDQLTGRTLEYTWHMIFGQSAHINYNTCDIFFCDSRGIISVSIAENKTNS